MWALVPAKVKLPQTTAKLLYWAKASWRQIALPRCKYCNCLKIHSSNTCRDTKCNYATEGMSVNMEGIQFLLDLGLGDSFPTLFPEVQVQWLCFRPPAAGTCWRKQALHQPSSSPQPALHLCCSQDVLGSSFSTEQSSKSKKLNFTLGETESPAGQSRGGLAAAHPMPEVSTLLP